MQTAVYSVFSFWSFGFKGVDYILAKINTAELLEINISRRQALHLPAAGRFGILKAVVQPVGAALPELEAMGPDPVTTPKRG